MVLQMHRDVQIQEMFKRWTLLGLEVCMCVVCVCECVSVVVCDGYELVNDSSIPGFRAMVDEDGHL